MWYLDFSLCLIIVAADRPLTAEPVDTMNLGDIPTKSSREKQSPSQHESMIDKSDLKLLLFPGQVSKITSLISLLSQQRDLCQRLQSHVEKGNGDIMTDFTWLSQLRYDFEPETIEVSVKVWK